MQYEFGDFLHVCRAHLPRPRRVGICTIVPLAMGTWKVELGQVFAFLVLRERSVKIVRGASKMLGPWVLRDVRVGTEKWVGNLCFGSCLVRRVKRV